MDAVDIQIGGHERVAEWRLVEYLLGAGRY
jgi:hypothetical protein